MRANTSKKDGRESQCDEVTTRRYGTLFVTKPEIAYGHPRKRT